LNVLVTGVAGRVGRALRARLAIGHVVRGLDRLSAPGVDCIGDLGDAKLVSRALLGIDAVVHCAALHAPHVGRVDEQEFQRVNVDATLALWHAARAAGVRRFVFTSTTALYGADDASGTHSTHSTHSTHRADGADGAGSPRAAWITEATRPRPRSIYHRSKLAAENGLREAACGGGPAVTVLRMSRCFAEPAPLMAVYRLHRGIDVRDVAEAHALALAGPATEPWRCFNVSGSTPFAAADADRLWRDAPALLRERMPALAREFARRGWALPASIDRVYVPDAGMQALDWRPRHGWAAVLDQLDACAPDVLAPSTAEPAPCC
jgi:UDP-glucose 4-epimerase